MSTRRSPKFLTALRGLLPERRHHDDSRNSDAEPRRLVHMDQMNDPNLRWGAELIRRAGPVAASRPMQARVRQQLDTNDAPLYRKFRLVRWAPMAALFLAAGAGATVGRDWIGEMVGGEHAGPTELDQTLPPPVVPGRALPPALGTTPRAELDEVVVPTPPSTPQVELPPYQAAPPSVGAEPNQPKRSGSSTPKVAAEAAVGLAPPVRESPAPEVAKLGSQLVVDALHARRAKRYAEVSSLTHQYLAEYPRGPLVEEALGLAMEAAANTHSGQRRVLARRYLARFPNGRFQGTAHRILQAP